ncbi:phosphotransferase [Patescibacteria group bacterium]|nr:phosphotransferase [Patescibacteria group bacterium]
MIFKTHPFQKRISYKGTIEDLLKQVVKDYSFGNYKKHKVVGVGYEDFNVVTETDKGKYFLKFFADFRDDENCQRYVDIILSAIEHKVSHPKIYKSNQGYFNKINTLDGKIRFIATEYIDGKTFFDLGLKPSIQEKEFLIRQASIINSMQIAPKFIYDSWAIVNFLQEYKEIKKHLTNVDIGLMEHLAKKLSMVSIEDLPHCFVHGDIIDTNVIRSKNNKLYILDFSVSNVYPRIQELAVMLCDILFEQNKNDFQKTYDRTLEVYQESIKLEQKEIETLPLYTQVAHAMHIIGSVKSALQDGDSIENNHWMEMGREGLVFTSDFWK